MDYICDICHNYIREKHGEKAVNHKTKIDRIKGGAYITYRTKAHQRCLRGVA